MIEKIIEFILLVASFVGIVSIILASIYDMKRIRLQPAIRATMRRLTSRLQPHVTIIITSVDDIVELRHNLRQIKRSHYKRYDVVAIVSRCTPAERRSLLKASVVDSLRIYMPRKQHDTSTIARAYKLSKRGEMVVLLGAHDRLEPFAIKQSVATLQQTSRVKSLKYNSKLRPVDSMVGLYNAFAELSDRTFKKALAVTGAHDSRPVGHPGIYWASSLLDALENSTPLPTSDCQGVVVGDNLPAALTNNTRLFAWFGRLAFIALIVYAAVSAALLQNPLPLLLMWAIVSTWLLITVWSENTERVTSRLALSLCVPIGMFVIVSAYVVSGVQAPFRRNVY